MMMYPPTYSILLVALTPMITFAADAPWPQFRGSNGNSMAAHATFPDEWSANKNIAWKVKVPGSGWAQPIVVGDLILIGTAVSDPPIIPKNMTAGVMDTRSFMPSKEPQAGPKVTIDWQLIAIERKTGKTAWAKTIASGKPKYAIHPSNTFATETPATDGERIITFFASAGVVAAHDLTGRELWKKDVGVFPGSSNLGLGASPIVHAGKVYVPLLNEEKSTILVLDVKSGEEKFNIRRDKPGTSWATPMIWKTKQRTELVVCGKAIVTSHDPETGQEIWRLNGIDSSFSSSAAANADVILFGNGGPGSRSPLIGVKAGATGDITLKDQEKSNDFVAFYKTGCAPGMASPLMADGDAYVINSAGLAAYRAKTGEQIYKERLPKARTVAASPFVANGKLYCLDETGLMVIVKTGPQFEVVSSNRLDDTFWSSPTPAGSDLYLRGVNYLYCVRKAD